MKSFFIKVPIYEVIIKVIINDKDMKDNNVGCAAVADDGCYLIKFRMSKRRPELANTIAHEVQHLVWHILDRAGMKLCKETQEAYCYLNGFLHEQIYNKL